MPASVLTVPQFTAILIPIARYTATMQQGMPVLGGGPEEPPLTLGEITDEILAGMTDEDLANLTDGIMAAVKTALEKLLRPRGCMV